jgi:hypothetical protein
LRPALNGDSEVDITSGTPRQQAMYVHQDEVARRWSPPQPLALVLNLVTSEAYDNANQPAPPHQMASLFQIAVLVKFTPQIGSVFSNYKIAPPSGSPSAPISYILKFEA